MPVQVTEWKEAWYGSWVDLMGDKSEEAAKLAMDALLQNFDAIKARLIEESLYLSAVERLWIHKPGESIGWKAPAKKFEVIPNA